jgi:hypothetical protein
MERLRLTLAAIFFAFTVAGALHGAVPVGAIEPGAETVAAASCHLAD